MLPAEDRTPDTLFKIATEAHPNIHRVQLDDDWTGEVFVNVPYSRNITSTWTKRILAEREAGCTIVALVPCRPEAKWFRPLEDALICFVSGRLRITPRATGCPFPSAIAYFGDQPDRFIKAFQKVGTFFNRHTK